MADKPLPAVAYLKIPDAGEPYLEGHRCSNCGATFLGRPGQLFEMRRTRQHGHHPPVQQG